MKIGVATKLIHAVKSQHAADTTNTLSSSSTVLTSQLNISNMVTEQLKHYLDTLNVDTVMESSPENLQNAVEEMMNAYGAPVNSMTL